MTEATGTIRLLRREDIASAFELSARAGWNQTEDDWQMLLELAPETCWAVEIDGTLASTTTLVCYGRQLGWIGMVLTRVEFQRQGLARRLFETALNRADELGIDTVKLDATEQGRPLYEKYGFRRERQIERWVRAGVGGTGLSRSTLSPVVDGWQELDRACFGADRWELLDKLAERNSPITAPRCYLLARNGRANAYIGPCVSYDPKVSEKLIAQYAAQTTCGFAWDMFPENREAVKIAQELGFAPQRRLIRMARGKELREDVNAIYAIAGFELG